MFLPQFQRHFLRIFFYNINPPLPLGESRGMPVSVSGRGRREDVRIELTRPLHQKPCWI